MSPKPRKPIDNRPVSEQYQFTQGDAIISREQQKAQARKQRQRLRQWGICLTFLFGIIILGYLFG